MATQLVSVSYQSKKNSIADVQYGFLRRMLWSQERHNNVTGSINALTKCCDDLESWYTSGNSNSTVAVGHVPGYVLIAAQGFTFNQAKEQIQDVIFKYYDFDPSQESIEFITVASLGLGASFTGIHAEMMIVRWLVLTANIPKTHLANRGVEIATSSSKGCCPNCAGWLNMYSVPHTARRDKLSGMWRHPVTLNKYEHSTVDPFTNPPKLSYTGHAPGAATINKAGKVLQAATAAGAQKDRGVYVATPQADYEKNLLINVGVLDDY